MNYGKAMQSKKFVKPLMLNALLSAVALAATGQALAARGDSNFGGTTPSNPSTPIPTLEDQDRSQTWPDGKGDQSGDGRSQHWPGRSQYWPDGKGGKPAEADSRGQAADAVSGARDANRFVQDDLNRYVLGLDPKTEEHGWFKLLGDHGDHDDDGAVKGYSFSYNGIQAGALGDVGNGLRLGGAFTYLDGRTKNDYSGKVNSNNYYLSLLADQTFEAGAGTFGLLGTLTYGWNDFDTRRGRGGAYKADYDGDVWTAGLEGRYDIPVESGKVTPYLGINYSHLDVDGFHEKGGAGALSAKSETYKDIWSTLGARYTTEDYSLSSNVNGKLFADLGWVHEFDGSDDNERTVSLAGKPYTAKSGSLFGDAAVLSLGAEVAHIDKVSFLFSYTGTFGDEGDEHAFNAAVKVPF